MRMVLALLAWLSSPLLAAVVVDYPASGGQQGRLTIYSTTDQAIFEPVVRDFQQINPRIAVRYEELDAAPLYERYQDETSAGQPNADLLLSTAMDLQVRLVNNGQAMPHRSSSSQALPAWARWRDEAFGFTFEPAVMVLNRRAFEGRAMPRSRPELLDLLRRDTGWQGRIGTYDIARSSVGYLLASQDARLSSEYGALVEAFVEAKVHVYDNTATLLDRLESGELAIGYNLLGSYAQLRVEHGADLEIVFPQDYTLAVSRTAVIPRNAPQPELAHAFLEYLLSLRGQEVLARRSGLSAVRHEVQGPYGRIGIGESQVGPLRPIALGPGLLVYLDQQKRQRLLAAWRGILVPRSGENAAWQ